MSMKSPEDALVQVLSGTAVIVCWPLFLCSVFAFHLVPPVACLWVAVRSALWIRGGTGAITGAVLCAGLLCLWVSLRDRELGAGLDRWGDACSEVIDRLSALRHGAGRR